MGIYNLYFSILRELFYFCFQTNDEFVARRKSWLEHEISERYLEANPIFCRYPPNDAEKQKQMQDLLKFFGDSKHWISPCDNFKREVDTVAGLISLLLLCVGMVNRNDGMSFKEILQNLQGIRTRHYVLNLSPLHKYLAQYFPSFVARLNSSTTLKNGNIDVGDV